METKDLYHFNLLKKVVSEEFLKAHKTASNIEDWKGEDIVLFQEALFVKTKAKVSEKWFYTYFKNTPEKLPRIDMLNLLSTYAGYANWMHFKATHRNNISIFPKKSILAVIISTPIVLLFILSVLKAEIEYHFCFLDDIKNEAITNIPLDIKILQGHESPIYLKTDSLGCFDYITRSHTIKFVVRSPYYKTDTIVRHKNSRANGLVKLASDDYALALEFYTSGNVTDWQKHKQKLSNLISNNAIIYQVFDHSLGIEMLSKDEFIRFLTIPTSNLKRLKILDKAYENGKIIKLKFMVK